LYPRPFCSAQKANAERFEKSNRIVSLEIIVFTRVHTSRRNWLTEFTRGNVYKNQHSPIYWSFRSCEFIPHVSSKGMLAFFTTTETILRVTKGLTKELWKRTPAASVTNDRTAYRTRPGERGIWQIVMNETEGDDGISPRRCTWLKIKWWLKPWSVRVICTLDWRLQHYKIRKYIFVCTFLNDKRCGAKVKYCL